MAPSKKANLDNAHFGTHIMLDLHILFIMIACSFYFITPSVTKKNATIEYYL